MRGLLALAASAVAVTAAVGIGCGVVNAPDPRGPAVRVPAGAALPLPAEVDPDDLTDPLAPPAALAPAGGAIVQPGFVRFPKPVIDLAGQRRVGIQIGHLDTDDVPAEYGTRIVTQTGTTWRGVTEVDAVGVIAERLKTILEAQGVAVDILPTTVPEGYLADAFVSLHVDGDGVGAKSGFKLAHGGRRGPYETRLLEAIRESYGKETGLGYDAQGVSRNMLFYYAFNWSRYRHATSPFTPSVIVELGFLSHDEDHDLLVDRPEVVASGVAKGLLAFLDVTPRSKLFGEDLVLQTRPQRSPSPSPRP